MAFIGAFAGISSYQVKSFAQDVEYPCEEQVWRDRLSALTRVFRDVGLKLGLQVPLKSFFDRISFEVAYRFPNRIRFVEEDGITIRPSSIHYQATTSVLTYLSPQLGISHFF